MSRLLEFAKRPRYALALSITAALAAFELAACATSAPATRVMFWQGCDGTPHAAEIAEHVGLPAFACPAKAAELGAWGAVVEQTLGFPALACVMFWRPYPDEPRFWRAVMILPPLAPAFLIAHEEAHIRGMWHPPFLPFLQVEECRP